MRSSICSGSSVVTSGSGGSNSSSSPPESRRLLSSSRPSTSTVPISSSRSATLREPTSGSEARKRSSRSPAASSGTRCFTYALRPASISVRGHERQQQSRYADDDEAVREVEGRPVLEVEEVRHMPQPDAVGQIRDAAPDHEPERDRQDGMTRAGAREEVEHPRDCQTRQQNDDRRRAREEPEG